MNSDDQRLLDRQMRHIEPPQRRDGVIMLALIGAFAAGVSAGGFLFAVSQSPKDQADDGRTALAFFFSGNPSPSR